MNRGKDICKELKAVRKRIAEENDIPLEIPECTYQGPCKGTCPRCESEVRCLENELARRIRMGKVASVAGLALGLAVSSGVKAQAVTPTPDPSLREGTADAEQQTGMCEVTGVVVDGRTREALPFANVMLYKDTARAQVVATDFDGRYRFNVPRGRYTLEVSCVGYNKYRREVVVKRITSEQDVMELVYDPSLYETYDTPKVDTVEMTVPMMGLVAVVIETEGTVMDEKTQEPLPFVNVIVLKEGKQVRGAITDFDGNFKLDLEEGDYEFLISSIGYAQKRFPVKVPSDLPLKTIKLESTGVPMLDTGLIDYAVPLIDLEAPGITEGMEVQGVQVRVQY